MAVAASAGPVGGHRARTLTREGDEERRGEGRVAAECSRELVRSDVRWAREGTSIRCVRGEISQLAELTVQLFEAQPRR